MLFGTNMNDLYMNNVCYLIRVEINGNCFIIPETGCRDCFIFYGKVIPCIDVGRREKSTETVLLFKRRQQPLFLVLKKLLFSSLGRDCCLGGPRPDLGPGGRCDSTSVRAKMRHFVRTCLDQ